MLLGLVGLTTLIANRVSSEKLGALVGVGIAWVLLVGLSILVQYQLYTIRPSFFDEHNDNALLLMADVSIGVWVAIGVFSYINKLTDN